MKIRIVRWVVSPVPVGLVAMPRRVTLSSNPAESVLADYLSEIQDEIGWSALHAVYPPNVP